MSSQVTKIVLLLFFSLLAPVPARAEQRCLPRPGDEAWMEAQMQQREATIAQQRRQAIKLLQAFLQRYPRAPERAGVLFRLAELFWERAQADFLAAMREYDRNLELFKNGKLTSAPTQPRIDLTASLKIYEQLLERHPDFEQIDTVLYLYGFGLNEQGNEQAALSIFRTLIRKYPHSQFVADAHMAIAEYEFAKAHFRRALASYRQVLAFPRSNLHDLALYKSAWCHFKLHQPKQAAKKFRQVLIHTSKKKRSGSGRVEAAAIELEREALEDLALTFSESGGASEAYAFMKQVGGPRYSVQVLRKLAGVFFRQARYDKAIATYRMLLREFPLDAEAPWFHEQMAQAYLRSGNSEQAYREYNRLADNYGPRSSWARQQKDAAAVTRARKQAEAGLRFVALSRHRYAQKNPSAKNYRAAAASYRKYLQQFSDSSRAARLRFNLGEVLFKLKRYPQAAEAYLAAARALRQKKLGREAAYAAVLAYDRERARTPPPKQPPDKRQKLTPAEQGFLKAAQLFADLAPQDPHQVEIAFEAGKLLYYRAHYAEAARRLLALVRSQPGSPLAVAAADLALDCFSRSHDYATLERQARSLKKLRQLARGEFSDRLDGIVAGALFQQALQEKAAGNMEKAAGILQGMVKEFPRDQLAPRALLLAGDFLATAGHKKQAVLLYQKVVNNYPDQAADATYILADLYQRRYDYLRAADTLRRFARKFPGDKRAAPGLLRAALLYRAKRRWRQQVEVLKEFNRRFPKHAKSAEALFEAGLALEKAGEHRQAASIFSTYLRKYSRRHQHQARLHLALALVKLNRLSQARKQLRKCASYPASRPPAGAELEAAAQCLFERGELIFRSYQNIKLRPPRRRLVTLLKKKAALLKKAESMFARVVATGVLEWASAALYRVGDMYAGFARSIYQAPLPRNLSPRENDIYRQQIQALAFPVEDKALRAFEISLQTARQHGYYSRWTIETMRQLSRLDPNRYPELLEMRPHVDWADSYTGATLLLEKLPLPGGKQRPGEKKK